MSRWPGLASLARLDVIVLTGALWFLAKFLRYAFPPLFSTFQTTYGVSNTILGAAFTAMMLVYAATQFPAGAVADRIGAVPVISGGGIVAAGAALLIAGLDPFGALLVGMVVVGLGTGVHKTVAVRLLSGVYPHRTGRAIGVLDTAGTAGGVAAPAAIVAAGAAWRGVFAVAAVVGFGLAAAFAYRVGRHSVASPAAGQTVDWRQYVALARDRRIAAFVAVTVLFAFAYNGVVAFLPLYLTDAAGLTEETAGAIYAGLFAVSIVQPLTGELSDRVGRLPVIAGSLGVALLGLGLVVVLRGPVPLGIAALCFGVGGHGFRPVRGAYLLAVLPEEVAGGGLGAVRTVLMGAGAVAPAIVGILSDLWGYTVAFGLLAAALAGAVGIALVLLGGYPRDGGST